MPKKKGPGKMNVGGQKGRQTADHKLFGKETVSGMEQVKDLSKIVDEAGKGFKNMSASAKAVWGEVAHVEKGLKNSALYSEKNKKAHGDLAKTAGQVLNKGNLGLKMMKGKLWFKEKILGQDVKLSKSLVNRVQHVRKSIPLYQKIQDKMKSMKSMVGGMGDKAKELDSVFGGIGSTIIKYLTSPWALLLGMITFAIKMFTRFSKVTDMVGEDFGYMAKEGGELNNQVMKLNAEGAKLDVNYDKFKSHIGPIASGLGVSASEAIQLAAESEKLGMALGVGGAAAAQLKVNFEVIAGVSRETLDNYLKQATALSKQAGVVPSVVMKDVAESSEMMAKYTKDGGKNILTAAINAKKFGVNLAAVEKITDSLLDIESSINKEFEASVMIGKQLNFQTARQKALQGDVSGAVEDVVGQLGGAAEFAKLDVLQRKSLAGAIGLSVTELSKMMNKQEEVGDLAKVTGEEMDKANIEDIKAENAISGLSKVTNSIQNLGDTISEGLLPHFKAIAEWLGGEDGEGGIAGTITDIGKRIAGWGEQMPFIGAGFLKISSKLKFLVKGIASGFKTVMGNVAKGLKGGLTSMAKGLKSGIGGLFKKGKSWFGGLKGMFKGAGKFLKKIPVLGSVVSVASGVGRAIQGDWAGAGMEFASAGANALNLVAPGVGTAASLAIDGAIMARDAGMWGNAPGHAAEDFVMRPGQPPLRFSKDDIIMGMHKGGFEKTGGMGGGGMDDETIAKLAGKIGEAYVNALNNTEQQTIITKDQIKMIMTSTV